MQQHFYSTPHADDMLWERYGIIPSQSLWRDVFLLIVESKTMFLARIHHDRERHLVRIEGELVFLIYDPHAAKIITALPPDGRVFHRYRPYQFHSVQRITGSNTQERAIIDEPY